MGLVLRSTFVISVFIPADCAPKASLQYQTTRDPSDSSKILSRYMVREYLYHNP